MELWADRAVELARQLGEDEIALHASVTYDTAKLAAGDPAAWASLEQIHQSAHEAGMVDPAARSLVSLSTVVADELAGTWRGRSCSSGPLPTVRSTTSTASTCQC